MEIGKQKTTFVYIVLSKEATGEILTDAEKLPRPQEDILTEAEKNGKDSDDLTCKLLTHEDVYVLDGLIEEKQANTSPAGWNQVLPNGESVLERQMRLLVASGIRDFVLAMEKCAQDRREELAKSLLRCLPAGCEARCIAREEAVWDMQRALSDDGKAGSVVLLPGNAVFDRKYAEILAEAESGSAFLSKSIANRKYAWKFARIDFKHVRELGNDEAGVNWFPALPVYKLDAARVSILEPACDPVQAIEEKIEQLQLKPVFDTDAYFRMPEDVAYLKTACNEVLVRDYQSCRVERTKAGIAEIDTWLTELQIRKPLLVCDQKGSESPVANILGFLSIPFVQAFVPESLDAESISGLLALCRKEKCDGVISAGGIPAVHAAKLLRVCCMFEVKLSEDMKLVRSVNYFPHIAVSLTRKAAQIDTGKDLLISGVDKLHPIYMIPEITVLDPVLVEPEEEPEIPSEEESGQTESEQTIQKVRSIRFKPIRIIKKILHPFPAVFRRARALYKKVQFTWYRHRYVIKNQVVVFSSFQGGQAFCNPRGIYEAMRIVPEYSGFQYIWAVGNPRRYKDLKSNPDTQVVKYGDRQHVRALATARYIVDNVRLPKYVKLRPEQIYIQTWHGKPIKHIGQDVNSKTAGGNGKKENKKIFSRDAKMITHLCVSSAAFTPFFTSAYNLKELGRESIIRETGYPRNDRLFTYTKKDVLRTKLMLGVPLHKKVVLYAPTWRPVSYEKGTGYIYNSMVDFQTLHEQLGEEYVIMFRAHINEAKSVDFSLMKDFVLDMTKVQDVNDLLIISDLLISDYSGIIFDFANLHRPIVLYQYDRDAYVNDLTGVYFNLNEIPGRVVKDQSLLAEAVKEEIRTFKYDDKYQRFNETYNTLDGADCGIRLVRELISPDLLKTERQQKQEKRLDLYQTMVVKATGLLRESGLKRSENDKALLSFKGKHKGERCFLIGNGPSLRLEDVEAIRNEYSFACNRICNSFDRTNWRPTYYCFTDKVFESELGNFRRLYSGTFFSNNTYNKKKYSKFNIVCAHSIKREEYYVHGNMLGYYVPSNATVMTFMIELAMYMGFSEIYLIGVDCSNGFLNTSDHFMSGYLTDEMQKVEQRRMRNLAKGSQKMTFEELGQYRVDRSMEAYRKLRVYADRHGIKVYNATRGGYLEAFERVNLDEIAFK